MAVMPRKINAVLRIRYAVKHAHAVEGVGLPVEAGVAADELFMQLLNFREMPYTG